MMKQTKEQTQARRRRTMNRLSVKPGQAYDVRKHRRALNVAFLWMANEGAPLYSGQRRNWRHMANGFTHKAMARIQSAKVGA
jgi:hypothetical protein